MEKRLFITTSPLATQNLGKRIGEKLSPGSVVALMGELGCGKTCFTKGLCAGLGIPKREVNSPSFTFANEYKGKLPVFHLDLYRVEDMVASLEVGVSDYLLRTESGVAIIEWAERILPLLSDNYLAVHFSVLAPKKRQIILTAFGERFSKLLNELGNENSEY
ncbi:MAG TPA: tRNA (adenosine(37)-N6)-threonylcarbamoyltransferase complex ATPase subunit type 1 TsaE [Dehalococcoidia bacterium]|nr:tRNA (adenosine(37)-N6)-threonylcarbamoyltransferase complex ATPase subunit type 1 TsaE [Dehalococcoidia bacterium]